MSAKTTKEQRQELRKHIIERSRDHSGGPAKWCLDLIDDLDAAEARSATSARQAQRLAESLSDVECPVEFEVAEKCPGGIAPDYLDVLEPGSGISLGKRCTKNSCDCWLEWAKEASC